MPLQLREASRRVPRLGDLACVALAPYRHDDSAATRDNLRATASLAKRWLALSTRPQPTAETLEVVRRFVALHDSPRLAMLRGDDGISPPRPDTPARRRSTLSIATATEHAPSSDAFGGVVTQACERSRRPMHVARRDPARQPASSFDDTLSTARTGTPWACRELYESFASRVCAYLGAHGAPDPEDLTNEVFLRVFERLHRFRGNEAQFRAWLFTISHHLLIDEFRRRQARPRAVAIATSGDETLTAANTEHDALDHLGDIWAHQCLASLPRDQRDVLTLRIFADLTIDQIADVLGKSRGAVKALQRRGLAALRRALEGATT